MSQSRFLTRREFLAATLATSAGFVLAACAPATQQPAATSAPAEATPAPVEPVTLEVWEQEISVNIVKDATDLFLEKYPDIKIDFMITPSAETNTKLLAALAAGSGAPDIAFIQYPDMINYTFRGGEGLTNFEPLIEPRKDEFVQWCLDLVTTTDGKIIGFPVDIGPVGNFYRRDVFDDVGIPSDPDSLGPALGDWDKFLSVGAQVVEGGTYWMLNHASVVFDILRQQGGQGYFDETGQPIVNSAAFVEAAEYARQVRVAGLDGQLTGAEVNAAMTEGKVATYLSAGWYDVVLRGNVPESSGKWGVVGLPGNATANSGGSYLTVPEMSTKKDEAWTYISFILATEEGMTAYLKNLRFIPAWRPIYEASYFVDPDPFYADQVWMQVFVDLVDKVPEIHLDINDPIAAELAGQALVRVLDEGVDPQQAFDEANQEIENRIAAT